MSQGASKPIALTGRFLQGEDEVVEKLRLAASRPLPAGVQALLNIPETRPREIATLLVSEKETSDGFWRAALGALAFARRSQIELPDAPAPVAPATPDLLDLAAKCVPELLNRPDFLEHCARVMERVEQNLENAAPSQEPPPKAKSAPRSISQSGMLPSIRYTSQGKAYACMDYTLLDGSNAPILKEEFGVEDMLFMAESAINSAKSALESAMQVVKDGQLVRHNDEETLRVRSNAIRSDLDEVIELLLQLREAEE